MFIFCGLLWFLVFLFFVARFRSRYIFSLCLVLLFYFFVVFFFRFSFFFFSLFFFFLQRSWFFFLFVFFVVVFFIFFFFFFFFLFLFVFCCFFFFFVCFRFFFFLREMTQYAEMESHFFQRWSRFQTASIGRYSHTEDRSRGFGTQSRGSLERLQDISADDIPEHCPGFPCGFTRDRWRPRPRHSRTVIPDTRHPRHVVEQRMVALFALKKRLHRASCAALSTTIKRISARKSKRGFYSPTQRDNGMRK